MALFTPFPSSSGPILILTKMVTSKSPRPGREDDGAQKETSIDVWGKNLLLRPDKASLAGWSAWHCLASTARLLGSC